MNFNRAFPAGVVGGAVMTVTMTMARMTGMTTMNMEMAQGSMMTGSINPTAWVLGFIWHLIVSGLIAVVYAVGFEYVTHRANWIIGAGFAVIHLLIAGVVMGRMGSMHPLMRSGQMLAPGYFAANYGSMTAMGFVIEHLIYGAIVGAL
jgi:hypothetical protein